MNMDKLKIEIKKMSDDKLLGLYETTIAITNDDFLPSSGILKRTNERKKMTLYEQEILERMKRSHA